MNLSRESLTRLLPCKEETMSMKRLGKILLVGCVFALVVPAAVAQTPAVAQEKTPSPELVGMLTKDLNVTPKQATGGAGALFGLAKSRLKPDQFSQVAEVVPGMDGLLKAAPALGGLSGLGSSVPGAAGGLAPAAAAFQKLGLSPDMVGKFVPLLTQFVGSKGGTGVASLLAGALK
jgi:Protein of unknown function VcgC/VcgE (DUF2780)